MRFVNILLIVAMGFSLAIAGEVTVDLNRIALLTPGQNEQDDYSSRIAIHFTMPDDVEDSDIIYAELLIPLDFSNVEVEGGNILDRFGSKSDHVLFWR